MLVQGGRERPLIPRYFDLLVFLVERRHEAVHRRDIFDRVWDDVVVSDSALSQAIRTIRRTLCDDSREPRFIRTVSRHGYRFVFPDVLEEDDGDEWPWRGRSSSVPDTADERAADPFEPLLQRVTGVAINANDEEEQREAAELLHALGTSEALLRLGTRPRHAFARALLRDTRWECANAGPVPILGQPAPIAAAAALVDVAAVLAVVGGCCGALGGAGVGAGLSVAEVTSRSQRTISLVCGAAVGGGLVGFAVQWLGRWSLAALVGVHVDTGGGLEGLVLGGAAGLGYAAATSPAESGLAAARGRRRLSAAALVAGACGLGALGLTLTGRPLVGGTVHAIAQASQGSQATLTPLGALIGEPDFGPIARAVIGTGEGALFGLGLTLGLTRRP